MGGVGFGEEEVSWAEGTAPHNITCSGNWKEVRLTRCTMGVGGAETGRPQVVFLDHCFSNSSHDISLSSYNQQFLM